MHPYRESNITRIALIIFFLLVLGYAYYEARGLIFGPSISLAGAPATTSTPYIEIRGATQHIADLRLDGGSIPVTEDGAFDQPFVLSPGENHIVLDAQDKYGKTTSKSIDIVYIPPASTSTPLEATSTPPLQEATSTASSDASTTRAICNCPMIPVCPAGESIRKHGPAPCQCPIGPCI